MKRREGNDNGADCCCVAARSDGGASAATTDGGVTSAATGGCSGWMGGGELSDSRLWLELVATFCSANLGSSACCSGGCGLFWRMLAVLDVQSGVAPTFLREMCSYLLVELTRCDSSVSDGG